MKSARLPAAVLWLAMAGPLSAAGTAAGPSLPFIEDDYPKVQALARSKKLPVFVEAWAPW